jgi:hypothetical protein
MPGADDAYLTVNYQIDIDDTATARTRRFTKQGKWPWTFPPRRGDYVAPDPELQLAAPVIQVIFRPETRIIQVLLGGQDRLGDLSTRVADLSRSGFREA